LKFFYQRLEGIFLNEGYSYDIVDAVLTTREGAVTPRGQNLKDIKSRLEILSLMKKSPEFPELLTAAKRVYNILSKTETKDLNGSLRENLLTEPAEKELYNAVVDAQKQLTDTRFNVLFELKKPINSFFDGVLVMDKRPEIRRNRLALLATVKKAFDSLGDFSKIVE